MRSQPVTRSCEVHTLIVGEGNCEKLETSILNTTFTKLRVKVSMSVVNGEDPHPFKHCESITK